jgi:hypothetical protein
MNSGSKDGKSFPYIPELDYWLTFRAWTRERVVNPKDGHSKGLIILVVRLAPWVFSAVRTLELELRGRLPD